MNDTVNTATEQGNEVTVTLRGAAAKQLEVLARRNGLTTDEALNQYLEAGPVPRFPGVVFDFLTGAIRTALVVHAHPEIAQAAALAEEACGGMDEQCYEWERIMSDTLPLSLQLFAHECPWVTYLSRYCKGRLPWSFPGMSTEWLAMHYLVRETGTGLGSAPVRPMTQAEIDAHEAALKSAEPGGVDGLTDEEHEAACAGEMANARAREGEIEELLDTPHFRRVMGAEKSGSYGAAAMGSRLERGR